MPNPTLIAVYFIKSVFTGSGDSTTLVTPSFTPANGEVWCIKGQTWGGGPTLGTPTGGSQTYTQRLVANPGGFACWGDIQTAVCSGSPGSMTISRTVSAACAHTMAVERWGSAKLAATPVTASGSYVSAGTPSVNITTVADNSIISWFNGDEQSVAPGTPVYLNGAVQDVAGSSGIGDGSAGSNSVQYAAYQTTTTHGTIAFGQSAPTGQKWNAGGIEIQYNPSFVPGIFAAF